MQNRHLAIIYFVEYFNSIELKLIFDSIGHFLAQLNIWYQKVYSTSKMKKILINNLKKIVKRIS